MNNGINHTRKKLNNKVAKEMEKNNETNVTSKYMYAGNIQKRTQIVDVDNAPK